MNIRKMYLIFFMLTVNLMLSSSLFSAPLKDECRNPLKYYYSSRVMLVDKVLLSDFNLMREFVKLGKLMKKHKIGRHAIDIYMDLQETKECVEKRDAYLFRIEFPEEICCLRYNINYNSKNELGIVEKVILKKLD